MRNVMLGKMSWGELLTVGGLFAAGLVSRWAKAQARSTIFGHLEEMGLAGLYKTILQESGDEICRVLRICADRQNHPVLLHCSHGKDRTGLTVALILSLLGTPRGRIVGDYHVSEQVRLV